MIPFSSRNDIMLIPYFISCPVCGLKYRSLTLLNMLLLPESEYICEDCHEYIFTKENVGKFFGVIKNVGK